MEDKITLDLNSFKALASETRVDLLKKLSLRRATASELAASEHISVQAISEHLEKMKDAGLVRKVDEGRKWIYFELTDKGKVLLKPEDSRKIWVLLTISILVFATGAFWLSGFGPNFAQTYSAPSGLRQTIQEEGRAYNSQPIYSQPTILPQALTDELGDQALQESAATGANTVTPAYEATIVATPVTPPATSNTEAFSMTYAASLSSPAVLLIIFGSLLFGIVISMFLQRRTARI